MKRVTLAILGTDDTPGLRNLAPKVEAAIANPKHIKRRPYEPTLG